MLSSLWGSNLVLIVLFVFAPGCGLTVQGQSSDTSFCLQSGLCKSMPFSAKWRLVLLFLICFVLCVWSEIDVNRPASVLCVCVYNCVCLCLRRSETDILKVSSVFLNHSPPYFAFCMCACVWDVCGLCTHVWTGDSVCAQEGGGSYLFYYFLPWFLEPGNLDELRALIFQRGWQPPNHSDPPVSTLLVTGVIGWHRITRNFNTCTGVWTWPFYLHSNCSQLLSHFSYIIFC